MLSCDNVADYFLALSDEDAGDTISNLKLQKLVYYAQGLHLAMFGVPLFEEAIEAWTHGPVVPSLYHRFKSFGQGAIAVPLSLDLSMIGESDREFLDEVYSVYGQFSAWKLRNMTHEEPPWKDTRRDAIISHEKLREYFVTQLTDE